MRLNTTLSSSGETTPNSENYTIATVLSELTSKVLRETESTVAPSRSSWQTSAAPVLSTSTLSQVFQQTVTNLSTSTTTFVPLPMNSTNATGSPDILGGCSDWQEVQHALFQLANLCLVLSFLTPTNFHHHAFFLRFILGFGYLFFSIWAGIFVCMPDVLSWNCLFFVVNTGHLSLLLYRMFPTRFRSELDELYSKVFKPLKVTRQQFKDISDQGELYVLTRGTYYAKEGCTEGGRKLSILVKGRLKVMYQQLFLHFIEADQLVDSPEYDSYRLTGHTGTTFQVSIEAADDSLLLTWPIPQLKNHLDTDSFMASILHVLVGKDVSTKLYQIQELLLTNPNYMQSVSSRRSSLVNVRSAIVTNKSNSDLTRLTCFGIDLKGWPSSSSASNSNFDASQYPKDTYESCV
ncbi:blood vessel epicardial substance-A-like [Mizuhopecten yessoensis]|uniref:Blood vessel epicardial substance n=1 Tax=Mizuhopecten yessoensis TaxID=6573 RepID=A0A210QUU1_MIZYE|nr:blood vessel epicardial substance-A-like [Mizuhopecten yessoensis]OWF52518.1 Blood vessel epicardial substance [Mizuhopecten yessoensis]